jgi:hypothetical protein
MHSDATNPYESDKIHFPELIAMPCVLAHTMFQNNDIASKHPSLVGVWSGHNQEQELLQKKKKILVAIFFQFTFSDLWSY